MKYDSKNPFGVPLILLSAGAFIGWQLFARDKIHQNTTVSARQSEQRWENDAGGGRHWPLDIHVQPSSPMAGMVSTNGVVCVHVAASGQVTNTHFNMSRPRMQYAHPRPSLSR